MTELKRHHVKDRKDRKTMKKKILSVVVAVTMAAGIIAIPNGISSINDLSSHSVVASAAVKVGTPKMVAESKYDFKTHPCDKETNTIIVRWGKATNAKSYQLYIKGGKYKNWTKYKQVSTTNCTVTGLARTTTYSFKVRGVNGSTLGNFSSAQNIKTARLNYDSEDWKAINRIVYHEVGRVNSSVWDVPIVYVADAVANRWVLGKYGSSKRALAWRAELNGYSRISQMIYDSGAFMSSQGLSADGASYSNVPNKVKQACYGAIYFVTNYKGIENNNRPMFWGNGAGTYGGATIWTVPSYNFYIKADTK